MADDLIISRKRLAGLLGVSEKTVSRMFGRGDLPGCYKLGGRSAPLKISTKALDKIVRGKGRR